MGASLGTGDKKSVNVELNIVPFLDIIMNILIFVLATVAVTFTATIDTTPPASKGSGVRSEVPSEALNRTIVPSHVRFAGTMHSRFRVQIPSPFTRSPFVPLSYIDWGTAQGSGLP